MFRLMLRNFLSHTIITFYPSKNHSYGAKRHSDATNRHNVINNQMEFSTAVFWIPFEPANLPE